MINYFRLRYFVLEAFYKDYKNKFDKNDTLEQRAQRCFDEFYTQLNKNNIESVIVISVVLYKVARYRQQKVQHFLEYYNKMMEILETISLDDSLEKDQKEWLFDDIAYIKDYIKKR